MYLLPPCQQNASITRNSHQLLFSPLAQKAPVPFQRHTVNHQKVIPPHRNQLDSRRVKPVNEPLIQVWSHAIMEPNIMVSCHNIHFCTAFWYRKQAAEPPGIVLELLWAAVLALVGHVAQDEDEVGLVEIDGGLECAVHLPFAAKLVEPVALTGTQQVGVSDDQGSHWLLVIAINRGVVSVRIESRVITLCIIN